MSGITRLEPAYDDMLGYIIQGLAGANQWNVKNIRDTLFPLPFLRNNSSDFYCVYAQSTHKRKQGAPLASIHLHWITDTAFTAGQTVLFDIYYTWASPDTEFPALVNWSRALSQSLVISTSNQNAWWQGISNLVVNVPPPTNEGYGKELFIRLVRGNGTWAGELGIKACDAHILEDRPGSLYEYSDVTP